MDQKLKISEIIQKHKFNRNELSQLLNLQSQKNIHNSTVKGGYSSNLDEASWKIAPNGYKLKQIPQSISNPNLIPK